MATDTDHFEHGYEYAAFEAGLSIINTLLIARGLKECFFAPTTLEHTRAMLQALEPKRETVSE